MFYHFLLRCFLVMLLIVPTPLLAKAKHNIANYNVQCGTDTGKHMVPKPFYQVVTEAINKSIAKYYNANITAFTSPQINLMWNYENANGVFNQYTFDYISARASKGNLPYTAQLSASGDYPNAYAQVISSLYYNISTKDRQQITNVANNACAESSQIITTYEKNFGTIMPAQLDSARAKYGNWITGKLNYIIDVVVGARWSGHEKAGLQPLRYLQLAGAKVLDSLLPNIPIGGEQVIRSIKKYLNKIKAVIPIQDSARNGAWTIQQLKNNTWTPLENNGGMQTFNANDGSISSGYQVAYTIDNSTADINNDLHNPNRNLKISIHTLNNGDNIINIITTWNVAQADTITYALPDSLYIDMYPMPAQQPNQITELCYGGVTMLTMHPAFWNDTTNKGWFFAYPISQAVCNDSADVSGYKFGVWPNYNMKSLADGGTFGHISKLLICNYQKLTISAGCCNVMGSNTSGTISSSFTPVPIYQQNAYVIGAVFCFP